MCNLYSNTLPQEAMRRLFRAEDRLGNQQSMPAVFPDAEVPIVHRTSAGERRLVPARWGYSKAKFGWVTNVRNLDRWPWKDVLEHPLQRCLVPATSFAEYHPTQTDEKGRKLATWFRLTGDEPRPPFAFAGLVRRWSWKEDGLRRKSDQPLADADARTLAMAFLTTEANGVVAPIHPKAMPVILRENDWEAWLTGDAEAARTLQRPLPDEALEIAFTGAKSDPIELTV